MSRQIVLVLGVLLWVSVAVVAVIHVLLGDWMGPLASAVLVLTGFAAYHARRRMLATP
jgi:hypothetical protein